VLKPAEDQGACGRYTGVRRTAQSPNAIRPDAGRLADLTLPDGTVLDPNRHGGVLLRLNSAHGSAANIYVDDGEHSRPPLMLAAKDAKAGTELRWDYCATTDDQADPLNTPCACGGVAIDYPNIGVQGRKCTGMLMQVVGARTSERQTRKRAP
jgi:hypothetical protein